MPKADLILGCTGMTSITQAQHRFLKKGCILASASSSDREFDSVFIRAKNPAFYNCFQDVDNGHVTLLNSGFPINFDGKRHSIAPEKIQITRALLTAGILQALDLAGKAQNMVDLNAIHQAAIVAEFKQCVNF